MALGDINIIGDVTTTLEKLLTELIVTFKSPAEIKGAENFGDISLYLYQVLENPYSKNQSWSTNSSGERQYPPLALDLYYLLTPCSSDMSSAHEVLSYAMKLF